MEWFSLMMRWLGKGSIVVFLADAFQCVGRHCPFPVQDKKTTTPLKAQTAEGHRLGRETKKLVKDTRLPRQRPEPLSSLAALGCGGWHFILGGVLHG
jgi:hypothetical protein